MPGPSAAEEAAAVREAETRARDGVLSPRLDHLRQLVRTEERRDRRRLRDLVPGWRQALLHRALPARYAATAASREWAHDRLLDLAKKQAEMSGHENPFALRAADLVPLILFRGFNGWTRAADGFLTTSDFPGLLDQVANRLFLDAYGDTVRSFTPWTTAITVADFKSTIASVAAFPDLPAIEEHGEYVAGSPFGPAVPVRLTKFGRVVQFTREAVLRDDVPSFGQLQAALGVAAAAVENDVVYDLLTSNPTMPDGQPLFSAAHGNLLPAAALDAASLATACAGLAANSAHGRPAFLLVGTGDGAAARRLVHEEAGAGDTSGALEVVQDDRITGGWYVTCDPRERPTVVTAQLAGIDGPELLARDAWDTDARNYKGRLEFGAAVVSATALVFTPAP